MAAINFRAMTFCFSILGFLLLLILHNASAMSITYPSERYRGYRGVYERLVTKQVDYQLVGCQCMMTNPSPQDTDTTMCACVNRHDGSANDSKQCRPYTDTVFEFCYEATDSTELWQTCVSHYCPYANQNNRLPPKSKLTF